MYVALTTNNERRDFDILPSSAIARNDWQFYIFYSRGRVFQSPLGERIEVLQAVQVNGFAFLWVSARFVPI